MIEQQYAVLATAPGGTTMVVSVHASEAEADIACARLRKEKQHWNFSVNLVIEQED